MKIIAIAAILASFLFAACKSESNKVRDAAVQSLKPTVGAAQQPIPPTAQPPVAESPNDATPAATPPAHHAAHLPNGFTPINSPLKNPEPAQNAKGTWHFTCSAGCTGGAGSAVACAKCGKTLTHNQAYHQ